MRFAVFRLLGERWGNVEQFFSDTGGATAIEYGLIAALISVVTIGAMSAVGTSLNTTFTSISTVLSSN